MAAKSVKGEIHLSAEDYRAMLRLRFDRMAKMFDELLKAEPVQAKNHYLPPFSEMQKHLNSMLDAYAEAFGPRPPR